MTIPLLGLAQKIKGKITDEDTYSGVAYVTVQTDANHKTITNENGEFELKVSALPCAINISHVSYQPLTVNINDESLLNIKLKAVTLTLNDIVVGNYALSIMQSAYNRVKINLEEPHYAMAFLRQIAYENDKPTYLNEVYFNAEWKTYGLLKWVPTESRYLKGDTHISYSNLSYSTLIFSGYLSNDRCIKPLSPKLDSAYSFKIKNTYKLGNEEIAIISCALKIKTNRVYFEGDYYVNTETFEILKLDGVLKNFNLTSKGLMGIKLKSVNLVSQYSTNGIEKTVLDFSSLIFKSKVTVLGIGTKTTELSNTLYMIDYNNIYNKGLKQLQVKTDDVKMTQSMSYNPQFWQENQTIKRTAKEEEAVKILEQAPQAKK
ncbi:carboxypeptidase-like regulatory domain-containing protein [Pedobacter nototheniae]|uniref:carboxypeptidase-like regulatory domain-containing protein n=1 Tax=Pedobacter nototheniae TaxID=2488994 RepID=UPI00292E52DD|nr:carboxypeptidase-like regulatory domain-containing protein [Pedobacter nototheniae]